MQTHLFQAAEAAGIADQHEIRVVAFDNNGAAVREVNESVTPA
jgi:hypothetical protein